MSRFSRLFTVVERRLASSGRRTIGGWVAGDVPVLLLKTTGRKSGLPHVPPLLYHRDVDGSLLLIAANGVAFDGVSQSAQATVLEGQDRVAAWPTALEAFPGLEAAQREADRNIPLVRVRMD